jgi:hypothetical protein
MNHQPAATLWSSTFSHKGEHSNDSVLRIVPVLHMNHQPAATLWSSTFSHKGEHSNDSVLRMVPVLLHMNQSASSYSMEQHFFS